MPIFNHQGLTFPLADALTKIHAAELMIRNAACLAERPFRLETSMAKLFATEMAGEAPDIALRAHGGYDVFEDMSYLAGAGVCRPTRPVLQLPRRSSK